MSASIENLPNSRLNFYSENINTRLLSVRRLSTLFNWRFQLLSQATVTDRHYRRVFKLARGPLPFVATDVGSNDFVWEMDTAESTKSLPLELRKRLADM